jgi:hypothetical protein
MKTFEYTVTRYESRRYTIKAKDREEANKLIETGRYDTDDFVNTAMHGEITDEDLREVKK